MSKGLEEIAWKKGRRKIIPVRALWEANKGKRRCEEVNGQELCHMCFIV